MARGPRHLAVGVCDFRERGFSELRQVFGRGVEVSERFGGPLRKRPFFPLRDVLAVSLPGAGGRGHVPGGGEEVPRLAGRGAGRNRFAPDDRLVQGARPTAPGGRRENP